MLLIPYPLPGHAKSQLEWHIESWSWRAFHIKFHPRKVMNRIPALLYQFEYSVQTSDSSWNLQCRPRHESQRANPTNVGEAKILKFTFVGYIQEYFIGRSSKSWHAFASLMFFASMSPLVSIACSRSFFWTLSLNTTT